MFPHRVRHVSTDIEITSDQQRLLSEMVPRAGQFENYSLLFIFWLNHARSFLNSAKVTGKTGRTIRNLKTTAEITLINKRRPAQASAHHPQAQCRISIIKNSRNTTSITRAPAKNTIVPMKRRARISK